MTNPGPTGGGACAAVIIDTGNKATAIKALCDNELLAQSGSPLVSQAFVNRIHALNACVASCLADAQDIADTYK